MKLLQTIKTRFLVWVWNHTPACAEMARLASRRLEHPPSFKTRAIMRLHILICVWCERYQKHLKFLHRAAPGFSDRVDAVVDQSLSSEAKQRMKARLQQPPAR